MAIAMCAAKQNAAQAFENPTNREAASFAAIASGGQKG
jgi:hypothetical protein